MGTFLRIPVSLLLPMTALYYSAFGAEKMKLSDHFIEYGFSPATFKMLTARSLSQLKEIKTEFSGLTKEGQRYGVQGIIDENFVNSFLIGLSSVEKMYSLREKLDADPRAQIVKQLLTTTTLGLLLPNIKEEYGEGKMVDIIGTLSTSFVGDKIEEHKPAGISINEKGLMNAWISFGIQIIVEKTIGQWEDARTIVATVQAKIQNSITEPMPGNETLEMKLKSIDFPVLKVFKGDEEQHLEQMVLQSLLNVQVVQAVQKFKPQKFPLRKFVNPREMSCVGINLETPQLQFHDGYITLDAEYSKVEPDPAFCEAFEAKFKEGPMRAFESMGGNPGDIGSLGKFLASSLGPPGGPGGKKGKQLPGGVPQPPRGEGRREEL